MRVGSALGGRRTAASQAVAALGRRGHEVRVLARSTGVDVTTGAGVDASLAGLDTLVDCLGVKQAPERAAATCAGPNSSSVSTASHRPSR